MGLGNLQQIVTRLATDPGLRRRFFEDPSGTAREEGWAADTMRSLLAIPGRQVSHYGEALVNKRCREVSRGLPLSFRALGRVRSEALFRDHAADFWPTGPKRHREDAIAFALRLPFMLDVDRGDPLWLADLAAYEAEALRAGDSNRRWGLLRSRHDWDDLAAAARSENPPAAVPGRLTFLIWFRLGRNARARSLRFRQTRSSAIPVCSAPGILLTPDGPVRGRPD